VSTTPPPDARPPGDAPETRTVRVQGIVQGVGFRPFIFRLATQHGLTGWVRNGAAGVEIRVRGTLTALDRFTADLRPQAPPAAQITRLTVTPADDEPFDAFTIVASDDEPRPTVRISPDLPVCDACLRELRDASDRRHGYPYINCTDCGPRYSIILGLPYDRPLTTMRDWPLCPACAAEYHDPRDRRFHAQPVACPACGPTFELHVADSPPRRGDAALAETVSLLRAGRIVAVKGLGGYHLACGARNAPAVAALRSRKYRKEKPFALMVRDVATARELVVLDEAGAALLASTARPIVLAPARVTLPGVAPDNHELGVMLPYTPLHHLLFDAGAPAALVMTSANRSNEPLAYQDEAARRELDGIADAFLIGQRPIARRVDDSVVRVGPGGPLLLRRARGYAPGAVAELPMRRPLLALGPDLKNTLTLVVDGQAFVSQHLGDLDYAEVQTAFRETIGDLLRMYDVALADLLIAHDAHPTYVSTRHAATLPGPRVAVQHHRAHVAAVLAEHGRWDEPVVGVALDGTGWGDDGTIWGGEIFAGSLRDGLVRVAHQRPARLPGGDAAARFPAQAAAGFVAELPDLPDLTAPPFNLPPRYAQALALVRADLRCFVTTSAGRLFDTVAALVGFDRAITFEGQAAIWLEQLARTAINADAYPWPELDHRPLLAAVLADRRAGRAPAEIARAFHAGVAEELWAVVRRVAREQRAGVAALSGGVFQNALLLELLWAGRRAGDPELLTNRAVPANDGGVSLGQAALASLMPGS
jgi:hydrogenase maturation protein HypF